LSDQTKIASLTTWEINERSNKGTKKLNNNKHENSKDQIPMEEFSNVPSETKLSRALNISKITNQFLQTLLRMVLLLGAICLISALWPLMSSIRQVVQVIKQALDFFVKLGNDLFSFLRSLTETLEDLY
jgi:hypothetical protein